MLKLDPRINQSLVKFFRWWGGELAFLVPERLRALISSKRPQLVISRSENGLVLTHVDEAGRHRDLGSFDLDESGVRKREDLFADAPGLREAEMLLLLSPGQFIQKTVKLPMAAEENLHQVTAFEMDRWTPFKADQVYFDARMLEKLPESRQIRVELALTPRQKLDPLLEELKVCGWRPQRVDIGPDTAGRGHDLLPEQYRPRKNRLPQLATAASAVLFTVMSVAVFLLPIAMNRAFVQQLQQEVKSAGKTAKEVEALKAEAEKTLNENGFLQRKKREEPAMVEMLNELSKVIPDQTWLNGLQYRDRKLVIQGQSPTASNLIELIEASPYFKNTSFVSPVTKDVASGHERFQIASEVLNGGVSEKQHQ